MSPVAPDPADKHALDAQADGGFQPKGTRFETFAEIVAWMLKGGQLQSNECERVAREIVRLQSDRDAFRELLERALAVGERALGLSESIEANLAARR